MLKNAGIKSKAEAVQRLVAGEVFYYKGLELRFDPVFTHPFRAGEGDLTQSWRYCTEWEVKPEWYEDLGEGVLCWVWDGNEETRQPRVITKYDPEYDCKFRLMSGIRFEHATPMTSEEVKKFLWVGTPPRS